uniref:Immunoglobulin subtype domain-containing protein n=1 Tax=Pundamilia nyererei TaxID=303518 RepID=A0A3B4F0K0_9CICH
DCVPVILTLYVCFLPYSRCGFQYVFVRHGKDLHLDIGRSVVLDKKTDLIWKFNKTNNVAKCAFNNDPVVFDKYEGRAELFRQNYSLLLKNVQHSDSGDYTAFMVSNEDQKVTSFKSLHVCSSSDPVSPVNLTVDSVSGSSESCVLAVTCSTVDSSIHHSFRCDDKNCSQQDFILCNHSNQVSWEYNKINIKMTCVNLIILFKLSLTTVIEKVTVLTNVLLFILKSTTVYFNFKVKVL